MHTQVQDLRSILLRDPRIKNSILRFFSIGGWLHLVCSHINLKFGIDLTRGCWDNHLSLFWCHLPLEAISNERLSSIEASRHSSLVALASKLNSQTDLVRSYYWFSVPIQIFHPHFRPKTCPSLTNLSQNMSLSFPIPPLSQKLSECRSVPLKSFHPKTCLSINPSHDVSNIVRCQRTQTLNSNSKCLFSWPKF